MIQETNMQKGTKDPMNQDPVGIEAEQGEILRKAHEDPIADLQHQIDTLEYNLAEGFEEDKEAAEKQLAKLRDKLDSLLS